MNLFTVIWGVWFLSEIGLNLLLRSGKADSKDKDKGTIRLIWVSIGVAIAAGILCASFFRFPIVNSPIVAYVGMAIIVLGIAIRFFSIWSLGRMFTVDVTIREDHWVKSNGIYGLVRHPSYSGSILSFIGFGLSFNNWATVVVIIVPVTYAMLKRIRLEEQVLLEQFGGEYADYMLKTKRLIPWIY